MLKETYEVKRTVAIIDRGLDKNDQESRYIVIEGIDIDNDGYISDIEKNIASYGLTAEAVKLGAIQVVPKSSCVIAKNANAEKARNDQMFFFVKGDKISIDITNIEFSLVEFLEKVGVLV